MLSKVHEQLIAFARAADGAIVSINEVQRGLACNCTCLACKRIMIARKGSIRQWSFAHQPHDRAQCEWAAETALHFAMKDIIAQTRQIYLPGLHVTVSRQTSRGEVISQSMDIPGQLIELESVHIEYSVNPIRPDVVAISRGKRLFIEVKVTHGVDDKKLRHIRTIGASALQIDLSKAARLADREYLQELLLTQTAEKIWLFHRKRDHYEALLLAQIEKEIERREKEYAQWQIKEVRSSARQSAPDEELEHPQRQDNHEDVHMPEGMVMCFKFENGGEAYLKQSSTEDYLLEFTQADASLMAKLCALGATQTDHPGVLGFPRRGLTDVVPLLNSMALATTNRSKHDYLRHRYGDAVASRARPEDQKGDCVGH